MIGLRRFLGLRHPGRAFLALFLSIGSACAGSHSASQPAASRSAGVAAASVPAPAAASVSAPSAKRYAYPPAAKGDVVEDYHGTRVADPYRWLEKADDPATTSWVAAENSLTRSLLDRPERETTKARLTELFDYPKISIPEQKGNRYFFFKNTGLQNQSVYYVQEGLTGEPRALIDPNTMSPDGTVALTNTSPN
ncbi:MAG: hypothetical protein DMF54_17305, partial [Acidobacteria bacterium]